MTRAMLVKTEKELWELLDELTNCLNTNTQTNYGIIKLERNGDGDSCSGTLKKSNGMLYPNIWGG